MRRLKGLKDLVFDAIEETTNLVERTHHAEAEKHIRRLSVIEPLAEPTRAVGEVHRLTSAAVYSMVRLVSRGVEKVHDAGYSLAAPEVERRGSALARHLNTRLRSDALGTPAWVLDVAQTALNGVMGDFLRARNNGLDLGMTFRVDGEELALDTDAIARTLEKPTRRVVVFIHGLACTEWSWTVCAERFWGDPSMTFGRKLQEDLGFCPLYVRYNTGVHVSENGHRLATMLEELVDAYPEPIDEIVLVGHSMGGLVARSAAHYAKLRTSTWVTRLRHVFCIGSPHLGAPLEQAGNVLGTVLSYFDTPGTRVPAAILNARSAGIKDLRFGYTLDEEWRDRDPDAFLDDRRQTAPLLDQVGYYFIASSITQDPRHPLGQLLGDLLVQLPSASGHHREATKRIPFRFGRVFGTMNHFHLCNHPDVYEQIRHWINLARALPEPLP